EQAEEIGKTITKGVADAYVRIAQYFVERGVPLGEIFSRGLDELRPVIVDSVGFVYDEVVRPIIETVVGWLGAPPQCNGEVLHDVAVFSPSSAYPITSIPPEYIVTSPRECGRAPHTTVVLTQEREFFVGSFPTTPAPRTE